MNENTTVILPFNIYSHKTDKELLIIGLKCHEEIQKIISSSFKNNTFDIKIIKNTGIILSASNYDFSFDLKKHLGKVTKRESQKPNLLTFTFIDKDGKLLGGKMKFIHIYFDLTYTLTRENMHKY
ncbi:hypothetical protein [Escherichia coli]|uniref:Uncharacterized protein n=1 Tax=Escherichia coli TaxID=562 RepID=A0A7U5TI89_ECOLX|nr:hypothetical protein [Escherichia coli]AUY01633.1 hypothetical protein C3F40_07370 [Escherichia coli]